MNWQLKALIGATGGLALVLLKLIEVQFFVDDVVSKKAIAAYLTYACYVALGVIVAVFFTDDSLEDGKRKKSAFIAGLLAPSLLLAIVRQPVPQVKTEDIFKITGVLVSSAYAQTLPAKPSAATVPVVEVSKAQIEPSFTDGLRLAIGRGEQRNYLFVLGQAGTREKAVSAAEDVNKLLLAKNLTPSARVIHPTGAPAWFVTLGGMGSSAVAAKFRETGKTVARDALSENRITPNEKNAALLVLEGKVVDGAQLLKAARQ